jgi:hypothetical protein
MARAKTSEARKAKPTAAEELTHGIAKLRELSTQIDDLSRDGFPYREAGRARTELSLRETIRRLFGEKSPEYQAHKNHKLRVGTRGESAQSTALIKQLIATLEGQKADLLGITSPAPASPPTTATERPVLTAVPKDSPSELPASPDRSSVAPLTTVTVAHAAMTPSVPMTTTLTTPAPAITPTVNIAPDSADPLPIHASASPFAPVWKTSKQPQSDPSPFLPISTTEHHLISATTDGTTSGSVMGDLTHPTPAPPITTDTFHRASPLETTPSTTTAYPTSASTRTIISQETIPPVPETSRPPANRPVSQSEPTLVPIPSATGTVEILKPPSSAPATFTLVETPDVATVGSPPDAQRLTGPIGPSVASNVVPAQPVFAQIPKAAQSFQATELSGTPPTLASTKTDREASGHTEGATLDILRRVCARFHLVARQLRLRKEYRPTLEITDEYDLQDLFYALLRLQFDEVGTEEWTPAYANGAHRTSYLLDWDRTVVVVKQTRSGLSSKDLAEQVKSDAAYYAKRPNGNALLCFIYDPDGRVGNPRGLEADLTTVSDTYMVEVIVAPK